MSAKKGNQDWKLRKKHGPDFKYDAPSLEKEFEDYKTHLRESTWFKKEAIKSGDRAGEIIDIPMVTPMSVGGFCIFADIDRQTFINYEKGEDKDLFEVSTHIRHVIETQQWEGATIGAFNPSIIARTLGLSEKTDVTTNGKDVNSLPQAPIINVYQTGVTLSSSEEEIDDNKPEESV